MQIQKQWKILNFKPKVTLNYKGKLFCCKTKEIILVRLKETP